MRAKEYGIDVGGGGFMSEEDVLTSAKYTKHILETMSRSMNTMECIMNLQKEQADRFNEGKPELSYLLDAPLAMQGLASRFSLGAKKYSRDNWKKGLPTKQVIDALLRHLSAYQNGEIHDPDGGTHVDAIVWNAVVLSEQFHRGYNVNT